MPDGSQYESSLERDFLELIRFDRNVRVYVTQPTRIEYTDATGRRRTYIPDGFIEYRRDGLPAREMPHALCEVKYREDFRASWRDQLPKFRAAKGYCKERGWEFKVFTEREIRTPYLKNVRFLWSYRSYPYDSTLSTEILDKLQDLRETDPQALLCSMFRDKWNRAAALPTLWRLVADFLIGCDLSQPLTMKSRIWTVEG
ncbi:MAG: heteromeric transposase endonuclease subunit TnsA [Candidatus Binataceae bacterium]